MKCKFCGEEMPERGNFCPLCGRDNSQEETPAEETVLVEEKLADEPSVEIVPPETQLPEESAEQMLAPEVKKMKRTAAISGCVAALAVLALLLFFGIRGTMGQTGEGLNVAGWFDWELFRKNDIFKQDSYTVSDEKAQKKADTVVATLGDAQLTNSQLQIYYQMEVVEFLNQYGYYLSYFGLDYTQPLDQQQCMLMEGCTWQQFFLDCALSSWQQSQALALEAAENDFQMDSSYSQRLDSLEEDMTAAATKSGFETADAFLQSQCGANATLEDYRAYMETVFTAYLYLSQLCEDIEVPSDEALADYFQANKETLEAQGIKQDGSYLVNVRHILVEVEGGVENTDGTITFPDAAVAAEAKAEAETILNKWLENPTEEYFGLLAMDHTDDGNGSAGGLYTGVYEGQMVASFNNWCFDESRQNGDYGIVETRFGYHIMYFSGRGEEVWLVQTRDYYQSDMEQQLQKQIIDQYEFAVSYGKIALAHADLA